RNPFTNITEEGKVKLKKAGVDVDRLPGLKAVLLTGSYCGADAKTFVNRDPNTIVVLGKDFMTHAFLYSMGPVLAVGNAHPVVFGANLVWAVEYAWPQGTRGEPLLLNRNSPPHYINHDNGEEQYGDFGWRRPDDFLQSPALKAGGKMAPLAV